MTVSEAERRAARLERIRNIRQRARAESAAHYQGEEATHDTPGQQS
jgi:hypothetical protein